MSERRGGGGGGTPARPPRIPGLPENADFRELAEFATLNTQVGRASIGDGEMAWCDNLVPVGRAWLRALPDRGSTIYTSSGVTITEFDFFTTPAASYGVLFQSDGSAVQVNVANGSSSGIGPAGTFSISSGQQAVAQAGLAGKNVLTIVWPAANQNGYAIWDGTNLFQAGTASPVAIVDDPGSGYTSAPTIGIFGGSGTGVAATATVQFGLVSQINVTAPGGGYAASDPPLLMVFSGGGRGTTAYGTATVTNNVATGLTIINGGTGFTSVPTLVFTAGAGVAPTGVVTSLQGGVITGVQLTSGGSGLTSGVTVSTSGGGGSGANIVATIESGVITSVTMLNTGSDYTSPPDVTYLSTTGAGAGGRVVFQNGAVTGVAFDEPSQGGSGYATPTYVEFTGGGGPGAGTITLMPFGVSGTDVETYVGRVWIASGNKVFFTAPGSLVNFNAAVGGGVFQSTDSFLRNEYTHLRQSNGFLYLVGDSSVNYVFNVTTSGSPSATTFSNTNIDPQIGSPWHDSVQTYSRSIVFANSKGIYAITGGSVQKASPQLDGLFETMPALGSFQPSSAVAQIYAVDTYVLLAPIIDQFTGLQRNALLMWNGRRWWTGSQSGNPLTKIATLEVNSQTTAYATDGTNFFALFQQSSTLIKKVLRSKLWLQPTIAIQKKAWGIQALFQANTATALTFSVDTETGSFTVTQGSFAGASGINYGRSIAPSPSGQTIGFTMTSTSADFVLITALLILQDYASLT